jgi:hypothetical protein
MQTVNDSGGAYRTLGVLWALYGIFRIAGAAAVVIWSGTLTVMWGAIITRVPDPFTLMTMFHIFWVLFVILGIVAGIVSLLAAVALLSRGGSGRTLALVASFFGLTNGPLGIALGAFTLYVFASSRSSSS